MTETARALPHDGDSAPRAPARTKESDLRVRRMLDEHYAFIWRLLRRFSVPDSRIDDCAQEVFMVAAQKITDITHGSERSFLFGTAMRVASQTRRAASQRYESAMSTPPEQEAIASRPDDLLDKRRARATLDAVLETLDEDVRTVFVLFELEGMSTPEIAALIGVPLGTAASRLRRGREEFQARVARLMAQGGAK